MITYSPSRLLLPRGSIVLALWMRCASRDFLRQMRSYLRLRANGRNNSQHCCANNVGSCCVRVGSSVRKGCTNSQQWWNLQCVVRKIQPVWPVSKFAQQHATTSNNIQQGVQTDTTCNIQQRWKLLANNVAFVCTGLNTYNVIYLIECPVQPDATLLANNFQHCWMLHVASVCTPCCMLLRVVGSCCTKFENRSNF